MQNKIRDHSIIVGGLLATSVLIFQSYLSQRPGSLDIYQTGSLIASSIAIPGLSLWFFLSKESKKINFSKMNSSSLNNIAILIFLAGFFSVILEIGLLFWRYSMIAGVSFIIVITISFIVLAAISYEDK